MTPLSNTLLNLIPDYHDADAATWIQTSLKKSKAITPEMAKDAEVTSLQWENIFQRPDSPFGLHASINWRKFVLATYVADLASYEKPVDQVDFNRLLYVMNAAPGGFRVWWIKPKGQEWIPAGYTGWYPMLSTMYNVFKCAPETLVDRTVVPTKDSKLLYLFNFSVAEQLKKTALSRALMTQFAQDIERQKAEGLACITVSEDGARIAKRFGLKQSGYLTIEGSKEGVYTQ